ncbi:MAG TPA: sigma-70 family RNA polymerase sigma factor [Solirubrobacterales bacterium]|nr:sigma-70 family RNA polymerase sigma factor [Solirubrobacterales bacterium]
MPVAGVRTPSPSSAEQRVLDQARAGDERAFQALVEPHRPALHLHCYRMLGSLHDAEDALQVALLNAWRGIARFDGRSSVYTWLHRIATNASLDAIARRPKRILPVDYGPANDPAAGTAPPIDGIWIEPYPEQDASAGALDTPPEARYEQREAVELAFVAALQHLSPKQRAALILRDVLGLSAREAAETLGTTVPSVTSALQRARRVVDERLPERSQQETLRALGDFRSRELVRRFLEAIERDDVEAILALLADDATFAMPPYPNWCRGRAMVAASWLMPEGPPPRLRYVETRANGQPAAGVYLLDPHRSAYVPLCLDVITLRGPRVADVTCFRMPELFARFGLPARLPSGSPEDG